MFLVYTIPNYTMPYYDIIHYNYDITMLYHVSIRSLMFMSSLGSVVDGLRSFWGSVGSQSCRAAVRASCRRLTCPKGPSANRTSTLGFCKGIYDYVLDQALLL